MEVKRDQKISQGLVRKRRRMKAAVKVGLYLLAGLILVEGIIYILNKDEILISEIVVEGNKVISEEAIKEFINAELSNKYLKFIPKRNVFLYPKKNLEVGLLNKFKRLESVSIRRSSFKELNVFVKERKERYLWCGTDFVKVRTSAVQCYLSDSGGYIFSEAPYYSGSLFLEFYGKLSEESPTGYVNGVILSEEKFSALISFIEKTPKLNLVVQKVFIKEDGDYELYLSGGGRILLSSKKDLVKSFDDLSVALESNSLKRKMIKERANLDYLDVRFGNKVFFKFK